MRKNEAADVVAMFREHYNLQLVHVDASDMFINALEGESDPETKRKTIGRLFIDVFEAEAKKLGGAEFLAQGTLYPDVIESVSFTGGPSVTIKSHHNVGGLPERMNMQLVEPLRELFKDEVRVLGRELGLPDSFIGRHPFPGPGLAIRCPGGITREKLEILREADAVYLDEIRKAGLYDAIWQAFAVLLPVQTVGVMGDGRTYEFVCALRAVTSVDGMTADFYHYDMDFLGRAATRIINEVRGINRVVYDVTSKPPGHDRVGMRRRAKRFRRRFSPPLRFGTCSRSATSISSRARAQGDEQFVQLLELFGHAAFHPSDGLVECFLRGIEFVQDQQRHVAFVLEGHAWSRRRPRFPHSSRRGARSVSLRGTCRRIPWRLRHPGQRRRGSRRRREHPCRRTAWARRSTSVPTSA